MSRPSFLRAIPLFATLVLGWACASGGDTANDAPPDDGGGGDAGSAGSAGAQAGSAGAGKGGSSGSQAGGPVAGTAGAGSGGKAGNGGVGGGTGGGTGGGASGDCGPSCSGKCVDVGVSKPELVCATACKTGTPCPDGTHCATLDGASVCVPNKDGQCALCKTDSDCKVKGDRCLEGPHKEKYCAQDCSFDGVCPSGLKCKQAPGGKVTERSCQADDTVSCPCAANRDGDERACSKSNQGLTCTGAEKCDAKTGKYSACTAPVPQPETCNELDDDCNGKVDDIPGAACNCSGGQCTITCQAGYTHYPSSLPDSAGCPCKEDSFEPLGDTCAKAVGLPALQDAGGTASGDVTGTLSSDADVDWYKINVKDSDENGKNSYHVQVKFDKNPGNEFVVQVIRGADCAKATTAPILTSYDFCVAFQEGTTRGLSPCGNNDGMQHCADMTSDYLIGVSRSASASAKTCSQYTLKVLAAAGACDKASFDACGGG